MSDLPRTFLVDGTAILYRAHFAFLRNPLVTKKGETVSAVYGLATTLARLLREEKPARLAVAFDLGAPTFRHERYADYKAHRPPMPEELISQGPRARELVRAMEIPILEQEGVEADDLIGTLAAMAVAAGEEAVIVSADKDFMQLVSPRVRQWIPPRASEPAQWIDLAGVRERWGVEAGQMVDLLALMGDASDNVPGVPGIGEKTAAKLLLDYGSLEVLYTRLAEVTPKGVREKLERGRESALLSRELVQIRTDLEPPCPLEALRVTPPGTNPALRPLLEELEFRRLIEALELRKPESWEARYRAIESIDELDEYLAGFARSGAPLSVDTETDSLDARTARVVGISLCYQTGEGVYLPLGHREGPNLPREDALARLAPVLADPATVYVGQNCKYDLHVLAGLGLEVNGPIRDTMLASYLLDPEGTHNLNHLSEQHLEHRMIPIDSLIGTGRTQLTMDQIEVARVAEYAAEDADAAFRLWGIFAERLDRVGLSALWTELECPLVPVLLRMERAGIKLDVDWLASLSVTMTTQLAVLQQEIWRDAGREFNIASPNQLAQVLFEELKLPKGRKTKTGYSTDSEVLEELAALHPVPAKVLEHRSVAKLKGTYVDALPSLVDPNTGRLHTTYNQTVAATGRLSSIDPNLQNIPIRSAQGREIRHAFVAAPGCRLICADYSQIELRIMAHLSDDPGLTEAFREGRDIHAATAERLFGLLPGMVDVELRSRAKTVNFGVMYGMGPVRLSRELGISLSEAKRFIEEYFAKMPRVRGYFEENLARARRDGYVTTLFGRRRVLRGIDGSDQRARAQAERIAANTPIQGSAADLIKRAMLRVDAELSAHRLSTRMLLQVHDELVLEAPEKEVEEVSALLRRAMEGAADLRVPLRIEIGTGRHWAEAHP
ncbi:MAG: DNA polymerase I [Candidatus Eisenbacteria bacterium]|nr:DNA polymerase I [Candidatus Eisenbacteria bacterium]